MEIIPNQGIGEIYFGMNPSQLESILGNQLVSDYKEWPGGNLNDCLCSPGFLFVFDKMEAGIPSDDSQLVEIWANENARLTIQGNNLFQQNRIQIINFLQATNVDFILRDHGNELWIKEYNWEIAFSEQRGTVSKIWMYAS